MDQFGFAIRLFNEFFILPSALARLNLARTRVRFSRIPTPRKTRRKIREYHPRQWVDRSGTAYRGRTSRLRPRIPPTAVGGSFKCSLQRSVQGFSFFICPFRRAARESDDETKGGAGSLCRLDLNDPPTPVGGIQRSGRVAFVCRLDLNDPPTAVGGIPIVFHAASDEARMFEILTPISLARSAT